MCRWLYRDPIDKSEIDENEMESPIDFARVDGSSRAQSMVDGMDATTGWAAVQQLRAWERGRLNLADGETLLDVGCGPADAGIELVSAAGPNARLLGFDASDVMLTVARGRAAHAGVTAEFRVGDASALPYESDSVDAVRSERMLQWLSDPGAALAHLVRVLRPGGRLVVIDTDWDSLTADLPDRTDYEVFHAAMRAARGIGFAMGRQLLNRCRDAGLRDVACTAATHVITAYNPSLPLAVSGVPPIQLSADAAVAAGLLDADVADRAMAQLNEAARSDRVFMSLTMYAVSGRKGETDDDSSAASRSGGI